MNTEFKESLDLLVSAIQRVNPKDVVIRDTWHRIERSSGIFSSAKNNVEHKIATEISFRFMEIVSTRGLKTRQHSVDNLLYYLQSTVPILLRLDEETDESVSPEERPIPD